MKIILRTLLLASTVIGCMLVTDGELDAKAAYADASISVTINQQQIQFSSVVPILESGTTMYMPIRPFAEQMGYSLEWRSLGSGIVEITISNGDKTITFNTGDKYADVNGEAVEMIDTPWSYLSNTYIPMRFLIDTLSLDYTYDSSLNKLLPSINRYPQIAANSSQIAFGNKIEQTAKSYLGVPYVYGGMSPSGFDCSGFVSYVFKQHGISLPRTAHQMYTSLGKLKNPQKGDIVFFSGDGSRISHAGISLGNNQYIHASSGSARKVIISNLGSSWSKKTYVGAKSAL